MKARALRIPMCYGKDTFRHASGATPACRFPDLLTGNAVFSKTLRRYTCIVFSCLRITYSVTRFDAGFSVTLITCTGCVMQ